MCTHAAAGSLPGHMLLAHAKTLLGFIFPALPDWSKKTGPPPAPKIQLILISSRDSNENTLQLIGEKIIWLTVSWRNHNSSSNSGKQPAHQHERTIIVAQLTSKQSSISIYNYIEVRCYNFISQMDKIQQAVICKEVYCSMDDRCKSLKNGACYSE
jgi:hypothetical protein